MAVWPENAGPHATPECPAESDFHRYSQKRRKRGLHHLSADCHHHQGHACGMAHSSNTTLHLVKNINGAPTLCREVFRPLVIDVQERTLTIPTHPHMPGLRRRYPRVEEELLALGIQKNGDLGAAVARLIEAGPTAEVLGTKVRESPLYLCNVFTP